MYRKKDNSYSIQFRVMNLILKKFQETSFLKVKIEAKYSNLTKS